MGKFEEAAFTICHPLPLPAHKYKIYLIFMVNEDAICVTVVKL